MLTVLVCLCRSIDNFVQAYRDMSPARLAMTNSIKRSFTQMAVVSFSNDDHSSCRLTYSPIQVHYWFSIIQKFKYQLNETGGFLFLSLALTLEIHKCQDFMIYNETKCSFNPQEVKG